MAVLHKTFKPELDSFMGSGHSISDGTTSHQLEPCFGIIHCFPVKVADSLTGLLSGDRRAACAPDTSTYIETPTGKLSDPSENWTEAPYLRRTSSPTHHPAISRIESEPNSNTLEDFILMDPRLLSNKPHMEILDDSEVTAHPRFRPRTRVPLLVPTERQDSAAQQLKDLDQLLRQERRTLGRDKFIPIRDTDEEDSLPDESVGVQQPTVDSLKSGEVSSFKLKPRRSRNPWDYKFSW